MGLAVKRAQRKLMRTCACCSECSHMIYANRHAPSCTFAISSRWCLTLGVAPASASPPARCLSATIPCLGSPSPSLPSLSPQKFF
jgi:hypothetical protein